MRVQDYDHSRSSREVKEKHGFGGRQIWVHTQVSQFLDDRPQASFFISELISLSAKIILTFPEAAVKANEIINVNTPGT